MSYIKKQGGFASKPAAGSLASNANIFNHIANQNLVVRRLALEVVTSVVSTGTVVVTAYKRPTPGSASGQVVLGTILIPALAAAPSVFYKDISGVLFQAGEEFAYDVTTAAAGGGAAGTAFPIHEQVEESPEEATNMTNHIASA